LSKLERLSNEREKLEATRRLSRDEFRTTPLVQDATCYSFIVAIQACIDIASHIVAALGLRKPTTSRDLFVILAEEGILPEGLVSEMEGTVGFRNILTHEYWIVDVDRVYDSLHHELSQFDEFREHILVFLEAQEEEEE
jgi:uncharacterized protein YutE (UPF0331/DUF86 family)